MISPVFLKTLVDGPAGVWTHESYSADRGSSNWATRAAVEENHCMGSSTPGFCNRVKQNEDEHISLDPTIFRHDLIMKPGLEPRYKEGPRDC